MNNLQIFTTGLIVMSALVSLVTEAVKKILAEYNKKCYANTLAGIVSLVLSGAVGVCYVIFSGGVFTAQVIVGIIAFVFLNWLCAMVGYDKVIQTIAQFKDEVNGK